MKQQPPTSNVPHHDNGRVVERIIESHNGNGGYNGLKNIVFVAVVLAAGGIIWAQQRSIDEIQTQIAVLNLKCSNQPLRRGSSE